jgi:hypothetical protein
MITPTERDELELQEAACVKLIRLLADLNQDGDPVDGKAFVMDKDGAYRNLRSVISQARWILGLRDPLAAEGPADFETGRAEPRRNGTQRRRCAHPGHRPRQRSW